MIPPAMEEGRRKEQVVHIARTQCYIFLYFVLLHFCLGQYCPTRSYLTIGPTFFVDGFENERHELDVAQQG